MLIFKIPEDNSTWFANDVEKYLGILTGSSYLLTNGRIIDGSSLLENGHVYHIVPRVLGGKGGFGSMLRAIGAQIEKTTSREACRDLSGRRIRDVNNEKKLKDWASKQAECERQQEEREERRRAKRAKYLEETPGKMVSPEFAAEHSKIMQKSEKAIQEGLAKLKESKGSRKRKAETLANYDRWSIMGGVSAEDLDSGSASDDSAQPGCSTAHRDSHATLSTTSSSASSSPTHSGAQAAFSGRLKAQATITCSQESYGEASDARSSADISLASEGEAWVIEQNKNWPDVSASNNTGTTHVQEAESETKQSEDLIAESPISVILADSLGTKSTEVDKPFNLDDVSSPECLEVLGLERLKAELTGRSLKCGGSLQERAQRLFAVKGLAPEDYPSKLLTKGKGQGKSTK